MRVAPDLPALTLAAKKTQTSLVETVGNSVGPGCGFGPSNNFYSVNPHILCDAMHCLTQAAGWSSQDVGYTAVSLE